MNLSRRSLFAVTVGLLVSALPGRQMRGNLPLAELFVSIDADVSAAISGLTNLSRQLGESAHVRLPRLAIGSILISSDAEADAFLKRMVRAIADSSQSKAG